MRRSLITLSLAGTLALAACGGSDSAGDTTVAPADGQTAAECAADKTVTEGTLTIATGEPAYEPWVVGDAPESKEGFEAAVAYAVAGELGFADSAVKWVRTTFDEAIAPGKKNYDFNLQQVSILEERKSAITFSAPYYTTVQAVVAQDGSAAIGAETIADLKDVKFGVQSNTSSLNFINDVIKPDSEPFVYDTNADAKAALEAGQIDAIVADLPTAFYIAAAELENASVVGQFPVAEGIPADEFGLALDLGNPLAQCLDIALASLKSDGRLDAIVQTWLADKTNAPVIALS